MLVAALIDFRFLGIVGLFEFKDVEALMNRLKHLGDREVEFT